MRFHIGILPVFTGFYVKRFRIRGVYSSDSLDLVLGWLCVSLVFSERSKATGRQ